MSELSVVRNATVEKFREIARAHEESRRRVDLHREAIALEEAEQNRLEFQAQQCHATAALFGFDIMTALATDGGGGTSQPSDVRFDAPRMPHWISRPMTVRQFILEKAEEAYPAPVRAKALKEDYERTFGGEIHDKTIGMTLYRIAQKGGAMRRDGWDWYFVPADLRGVNSETQELPYDGS